MPVSGSRQSVDIEAEFPANEVVEVGQDVYVIELIDIRSNGSPYAGKGLIAVKQTRRGSINNVLRVGDAIQADVDGFYVTMIAEDVGPLETITADFILYTKAEFESEFVARRQGQQDPRSVTATGFEARNTIPAGSSERVTVNPERFGNANTVVIQTVNVLHRAVDPGQVQWDAVYARQDNPQNQSQTPETIIANGIGQDITTTQVPHVDVQNTLRDLFPYALGQGYDVSELQFEFTETGGVDDATALVYFTGYVPQ